MCRPAKLVAGVAYLAAVLTICSSCGAAGSDASPSVRRASIAQGVRFIGSVDTMKLSKDRADNLSVGEINGHAIPRGPIARQLDDLFEAYISEYVTRRAAAAR